MQPHGPHCSRTKYPIKKLLSRRVVGEVQYLVDWDIAEEEPTWEPEQTLIKDCPTLVDNFNKVMEVQTDLEVASYPGLPMFFNIRKKYQEGLVDLVM